MTFQASPRLPLHKKNTWVGRRGQFFHSIVICYCVPKPSKYHKQIQTIWNRYKLVRVSFGITPFVKATASYEDITLPLARRWVLGFGISPGAPTSWEHHVMVPGPGSAQLVDSQLYMPSHTYFLETNPLLGKTTFQLTCNIAITISSNVFLDRNSSTWRLFFRAL